MGEARLQVVGGTGEALPFSGRAGHARGFVLLERAYQAGATPAMVADAYHEGRRAAVASIAEGADAIFAALREELARTRFTLPAEAIEDIEAPPQPLQLLIIFDDIGGDHEPDAIGRSCGAFGKRARHFGVGMASTEQVSLPGGSKTHQISTAAVSGQRRQHGLPLVIDPGIALTGPRCAICGNGRIKRRFRDSD